MKRHSSPKRRKRAVRCAAFHIPTGVRCTKRVSQRPCLYTLRLCATHGRSLFILMEASFDSPQHRAQVAAHPWKHISEAPAA